MVERSVFANFYSPVNIRGSALGNMGYVIAIPEDSTDIEIIRYTHYAELDRDKDCLLGPKHFIKKMIAKYWNCIAFYGVNSSTIKELYQLSPHPRPISMDVKGYNRGIVDNALTLLLKENQPKAISEMLLEPRVEFMGHN